MIFKYKTDEEILKKNTQEFIDLYGKDKFEKLDKLFTTQPEFQHYLKSIYQRNPDRENFIDRIFLDLVESIFKNGMKKSYIYNERIKVTLLMQDAPLEDYRDFVIQEFIKLGITPRHTLEEVERVRIFIERLEKKEELTKADLVQVNKEIRIMDLTPLEFGKTSPYDDILSKKRLLHYRLHKLLFEKDPKEITSNPFNFKTEENKKRFKQMFEEQIKEREIEMEYFEFLFGEDHTDGVVYAYAIDAADYYTQIGNERLNKIHEKQAVKLFLEIQKINVKINEIFFNIFIKPFNSQEYLDFILMKSFREKIPTIIKDCYIFFKNIIFTNNIKRYFFFKTFILIVLMLSIIVIIYNFYQILDRNYNGSILTMKFMSFPYLKSLNYGDESFYYRISDRETDQWDPLSLNAEYDSAFVNNMGDTPFVFYEYIHKFFMEKYNRYSMFTILFNSTLDVCFVYCFEKIYFWIMFIPFLLYFHAFKKITSLILDYFNLTKNFLFILIFLTTILSLMLAIPSFLYFYNKILGIPINLKIQNIKNFENTINDIFFFKDKYLEIKNNISRFTNLRNIYILETCSLKGQFIDFIKLHKTNQSYIPMYKNITKEQDLSLRVWSGKTSLPIKECIKGGLDGYPSHEEFVIRNKITFLNFSEPLMIYDYFSYNRTKNSSKISLIQKDPLENLKIFQEKSVKKLPFLKQNSNNFTNYYYNSYLIPENFFLKKYEQEENLNKIWKKINIRYSIDFLDSMFFGKYLLNIIDCMYDFFNKNSDFNFIKTFRKESLEYLAKPKKSFLTRLLLRINTTYDFHLYDNYANRFNKVIFSNFFKELHNIKFHNLKSNVIEIFDTKSYNFYSIMFLNESNIKIKNLNFFNENNIKHHINTMGHYYFNMLPETVLQLNATYHKNMGLYRFGFNEAKQNIGIHNIKKIPNLTFFIRKLFTHPTFFDFDLNLKFSTKILLKDNKIFGKTQPDITLYTEETLYNSYAKKPKLKNLITNAQLLMLKKQFYKNYLEAILILTYKIPYENTFSNYTIYEKDGILYNNESKKICENNPIKYSEIPKKNISRIRHFSPEFMEKYLWKR